ncbi:uncharacterized protein PAC_15607 [Phialocephala subalpina]|uniref:Xylanolytic transcriptional activator regulatory domain-containing protein n=1 Tax=Phialocephala subalpina TaxID=576137 RepID=A0A1L7XL95_9HELO|nr:uncharacterized protein PAC_15607 [Phialocephala subalpina]
MDQNPLASGPHSPPFCILDSTQADEDIRACRIIGLAARLCLEMGLSRHDVLQHAFPEEREQSLAVTIFWPVYTLDRRASLGTGVPFIIQDSDVDPSLPEPVVGKAWNVTNGFGNTANDFKLDEITYLDHQLLQWQKRIPEALSYNPLEPTSPYFPGHASTYVRAILYARTNQLRNVLYRHVLDSPARIEANLEHAQNVVEITKATIRMLSILHKTTNVYRNQPVIFNHFLIAALGVLFLAVTIAPAEFGHTICDEYYVALELIKGVCDKTPIVLRLWKTIEMLPDLGLKLGLMPKLSPVDTESCPLTGTTAEMGILPLLMAPPINGMRIRDDFANLFEATNGCGGGVDFQSIDQGGRMDMYFGQSSEMSYGGGMPRDEFWMLMPSSF